eukprot:2079396-Amphidinium_carterae.2
MKCGAPLHDGDVLSCDAHSHGIVSADALVATNIVAIVIALSCPLRGVKSHCPPLQRRKNCALPWHGLLHCPKR